MELRVRRRRELLMRARAHRSPGSRCCSSARRAPARQDRPAVVIDPGQARTYGAAVQRFADGSPRPAPGRSARSASRSRAASSSRASSG